MQRRATAASRFDPNEIPNGLWFQGCYLVVMDGAGYQADPLDLELHWHGETCAAQ